MGRIEIEIFRGPALEIENEDFDVLYPRDGIVVHTNHFISTWQPKDPGKDTGFP